jgi:hypothetical protein
LVENPPSADQLAGRAWQANTDIEAKALPASPVLSRRARPFGTDAETHRDHLLQNLNNLVHQLGVVLDPPPDGRVIDGDAALCHHLLELAIADRVFRTYALQDAEGVKIGEV